jgi:hypothetical protein
MNESYKLMESGLCSPPYDFIEDEQECANAAAGLQLPVEQAGTKTDPNAEPYGCFHVAQKNRLYFNLGGTKTYSANDKYRLSICKLGTSESEVSADDYYDAAAAAVAAASAATVDAEGSGSGSGSGSGTPTAHDTHALYAAVLAEAMVSKDGEEVIEDFGSGSGSGSVVDRSDLPYCTDGTLDYDETDVDCGGKCAACVGGKQCALDSDCVSELCQLDGTCAAVASGSGSGSGLAVPLTTMAILMPTSNPTLEPVFDSSQFTKEHLTGFITVLAAHLGIDPSNIYVCCITPIHPSEHFTDPMQAMTDPITTTPVSAIRVEYEVSGITVGLAESVVIAINALFVDSGAFLTSLVASYSADSLFVPEGVSAVGARATVTEEDTVTGWATFSGYTYDANNDWLTLMPTPSPFSIGDDDLWSTHSPTMAPTADKYCDSPNQDITLWVIPGTEGYKCKEASLVPRVDNVDECAEYCSITLGGPPACNYINFDEDDHCWLSSKCTGHEDPLANLLSSPVGSSGIMQREPILCCR